MWSFGSGPRDPDVGINAGDAADLADRAVQHVDGALGAGWYTDPGNDVDRAVATLCRLRRAEAGRRRTSEGGDDAVRTALECSKPEAVVWVASRLISYMDEHGFPEDVEPWLAPR